MKQIISALSMVLICGNSYAGFWDGNQLHRFCESDDAVSFGFCSGYISAVYDTQAALAAWRSCAFGDNRRTVEQLQDIVRNWSKANPQFRSMAAANMVSASLFESYKPTLRWREDAVYKDGKLVREAKYSRVRTDNKGKWVAYCTESDLFMDGADMFIWMSTLPQGLKERHKQFMFGLMGI